MMSSRRPSKKAGVSDSRKASVSSSAHCRSSKISSSGPSSASARSVAGGPWGGGAGGGGPRQPRGAELGVRLGERRQRGLVGGQQRGARSQEAAGQRGISPAVVRDALEE